MKRAGVHRKGTFSLLDMIDNARSRSDFKKAGAFPVFVGVVRGETEEGEKVQKLELEAYEEEADNALARICDELRKKPGIVDVQIHHLLGEFNVGEDLVYVLVAGSHRQKIYPVLQEAVERYKGQVPIFKKEHTLTKQGKRKAYWLEETTTLLKPKGQPSTRHLKNAH
jgi:molybdopterin synthase catalytic subunit